MTAKYVLDSDIFIRSKNQEYGMDFCPAFWEWLVLRNQSGVVFSIDRICKELEQCADELCEWAKSRGNGFFLPFDQVATDRLPDVAQWARNQAQYKPSALAEFLSSADMYLIAFALAHDCVVVTHETLAPPDTIRKIKIPNVCVGLGVKYTTLWDLLRLEGARFVSPQS